MTSEELLSKLRAVVERIREGYEIYLARITKEDVLTDLDDILSFLDTLEKEDKHRLNMTELEIKQKANDLAEAVRHAYITGALDNAKGDSETFAEHYGCLSDTAQEELRPVLPGAAVYEGLSDSLALAFSRYLDSNRGEGKMCLSAMECQDIMCAFRRQDWKTIERYRIKYLFNKND